MIRMRLEKLFTSLWLPIFTIIGLALVAATASQLSSATFWALEAILLLTLGVWKINVFRRFVKRPVLQPNTAQIESLRPRAGIYLALYFSFGITILGYGIVSWYLSLSRDFTFFGCQFRSTGGHSGSKLFVVFPLN
jgi:hypothetical protein